MSETNEHLQADGSSEDKPRRGHNNPPDAVSEYAAARDEAKRYLLGLIRDEIKQDTSKISGSCLLIHRLLSLSYLWIC